MHFGHGACEPASACSCMSEIDLERSSSTCFRDYPSPPGAPRPVMGVTIKKKRHACVPPPTPHPQGARRSVRHVLMNQRNVTDNATGYNRWDPEQPRSEDRTGEGQVKNMQPGARHFFGMVARRSWGRSPAVQDMYTRLLSANLDFDSELQHVFWWEPDECRDSRVFHVDRVFLRLC